MIFLTRTYVEALGLPIMPFRVARSTTLRSSEGALPPAGESGLRDGVTHDDRVYLRDSSLSFRYAGPA